MVVAPRSCVFVAMSMLLLGTVVAHQGSTAVAHKGKATPIQTVIELLESLTEKVTEDGKKEATIYDKFACFCKAQADDKLYAIETSMKAILEMNAHIDNLEGETAALTSEIQALEKSITKAEKKKKDEIANRTAKHEDFLVDKTMLENGIAAVENAIETLQEAKGNLVDAKLTGNLLQKTKSVLAKFAPVPLALLAKRSGEPGEPAKYQYQGNQLLGILADILETFKKNLKEMELTEFEAKKASDEKVLGLTNKIAFTKKDKANDEATLADKQKELDDTKAANAEEKAEKKADEDFLKTVEDECQAKAHQWDKRSLLRANELTALAQATKVLKEGALENFKANKLLVGFQQVSAKSGIKKASFLQLRQVNKHSQGVANAVQKAQSLLADEANRLHSPALISVAVRVLVAKDHFVKVRGLIKDLIAQLEASAKAEATQKQFCDQQMNASITSRDEASAAIEQHTAKIDKLEAENAKLMSEIATLSKESADLRQHLMEATALRNEESADNAETESMSDDGKKAVEEALTILRDFYGAAAKAALLQYVPPNADRSGKNIRDYQDEIFTDTYKGEQTESVGIIGILETILSDFTRTNDNTKAIEAMSEAEFQEYKRKTLADISAKGKAIKLKEAKVADNDEDLITEKKDLKTQTSLKESALTSLAELKKSCVDGEETYAERVKKRQEEIAALKEAMQILIDWQGL